MKWRFDKNHTHIISVVFLTAVLLVSSGCSNSETEASTKKVVTVKAQKQDMSQGEAFSGKLRAAQEVFISPKLSGKVAAIGFEIGDAVKKGDVLFSLENDELKAQQLQSQSGLNQAEANLTFTRDYSTSQQKLQAKQSYDGAKLQFNDAKSLLERNTSLYESGAVSRKQLEDVQLAYNNAKLNFDKAAEALRLLEGTGAPQSVSLSQAQLGSAKATAELARLQLENSEIKSPIDGVVSMKNLDIGEIVPAGNPVLAVVDNSYMQIELDVPVRTALQLKKGIQADIGIRQLSLTRKGEIFAIAPAADNRSGLYTVKIKIDNGDNSLRQGLIAEIRFSLDKKSGVLTVPNQAVLVEDGVEYIFVNDNGTARKKSVKTGLSDEKYTEILDSVSEGEEIVVEGQSFLSDGDKIKT